MMEVVVAKRKPPGDKWEFDGDIIEIEKATNYNSDIISLSKSTISPSEIKVDVIGEVNNPGE